jgi:hypothetical protein
LSKITTLYDAFITRIAAVLTGHLRLSDPYLFLKNTDSEKRKGYGVRIASGNHTGNNVSCDIILQQELVLVISRQTQATSLEGSGKASTDKQLMEDLFLVIADIEKEPVMGQPTVVLSGEYVSHGGIEFLDVGDEYRKVEATFSFRYRQDLN